MICGARCVCVSWCPRSHGWLRRASPFATCVRAPPVVILVSASASMHRCGAAGVLAASCIYAVVLRTAVAASTCVRVTCRPRAWATASQMPQCLVRYDGRANSTELTKYCTVGPPYFPSDEFANQRPAKKPSAVRVCVITNTCRRPRCWHPQRQQSYLVVVGHRQLLVQQ